jgi:GNAT superfamily N-acetyltransferase
VDGIEIRPAQLEDAAAVASVYLDSLRATYDFPPAHTDEEVRAWIADVVIPAGRTWTAVTADRVVAMLVVQPGDLDQLYVHPDWQGRGIGRALVDIAKHESPGGLGLYTFQVNVRARRFYERNGFVADSFGDGSGNEERQPDVHYSWPGASPPMGRPGASAPTG